MGIDCVELALVAQSGGFEGEGLLSVSLSRYDDDGVLGSGDDADGVVLVPYGLAFIGEGGPGKAFHRAGESVAGAIYGSFKLFLDTGNG